MHARILLFAYGTLLEVSVQQEVFGRRAAVVSATLPGWSVRRNFVHGRYPGIVRTSGASAAGGILKITAQELAQADAYEGAPQLYERQRVTVKLSARSVRCWVYVPTSYAAVGRGRLTPPWL